MNILIDPGHGGIDPGAVANRLQEKDLTLQISLYQKERFIQHGLNVVMTREIDSTEPDLSDRMYMARECDLSISNHINAGGGIGFEIWKSIKMDNVWSNMIIDEIKNLGIISRGIKTRESTNNPGNDYFAMNRTQPAQGIIVEYSFIDSSDYLILINRWVEMAEAVIKATVEYLGIKYMEVDKVTNVPIKVNGIEITGILYNDSSYAPVRKLAEMLGYKVEWDSKNKIVNITK